MDEMDELVWRVGVVGVLQWSNLMARGLGPMKLGTEALAMVSLRATHSACVGP